MGRYSTHIFLPLCYKEVSLFQNDGWTYYITSVCPSRLITSGYGNMNDVHRTWYYHYATTDFIELGIYYATTNGPPSNSTLAQTMEDESQ
jgi:hypothetical protein